MSGLGKLDFSRVRFVQRSEEVKQLKNIYETQVNVSKEEDDAASQLVLISGYSGCGKSRLVDAFAQKITPRNSFYYTSGKYQQNSQMMEPFSGIKQAFANLCTKLEEEEDELLERSGTSLALSSVADGDDDHEKKDGEDTAASTKHLFVAQAVGAEVREALGHENMLLLVGMIPELSSLGIQTEEQPASTGSMVSMESERSFTVEELVDDSETALQRVCSAFRVLVQSVVKVTNKSLIILLDDIQWMDRGSLEIMKRLTADMDSSKLMLIGAYRDNEISNEMKRELKAVKQKDPRFVHSIALGNLSQWGIQEILADLLRHDPEDTESLAELVLERTQGNVFFVIQYLSILQGNGLEMNLQQYRWTWNVDKIRESTQITNNVVDLLMTKMERLSPAAQECLLVAASGCWAKITFDQLKAVLEGLHDANSSDALSNLQEVLNELVAEGHLLALPKGRGYTFSHDRVKEAAYALNPKGLEDKESLHYTIGNIFRTFDDDCASRFVAADQLSRSLSSISEDEERIDLAELYLEVGQKSRKFAAFSCAVAYLGSGLELLKLIDGNPWVKQYSLYLELSQSMADALWCLGRHEELQEVVNDILGNATSLDDKVDAYYALAQSYGAQEKIKEALEVELSILKELNQFPKMFKIGTVVSSVISLKRKLKKKSVAEIATLPKTEDRRIIQASRLLMLVCKHAGYISDDITQTLSIVLRLKMALEHGICDPLISTFAQFGIILSAMFDDVQEGSRLGEMSMELDRKYGGGLHSTWTYFVIYIFFTPWYVPLQETVEPLAEAYRKGLKVGDVEVALCCFMGSSYHHFQSGLGLRPLLRDVRNHLNTSQEFNQNAVIAMVRPLYQIVKTLTGDRTKDDKWAIADEEAFLVEEQGNKFGLFLFHLYKMMTEYYFGNPKAAMKSLKLAKSHSKTDFSCFGRTNLTFFQALIPLTLAMQTKKGKDIRLAKAGTKNMDKLGRRQSKALNLVHKIKILEAGVASLSKKADRNEVLGNFDKAIALSSRTGMMQDTAVAKLLAHQFFQATCKEDDSESEFYLESALATFEDWGASALFHKRQGRRQTMVPLHPMTVSSGASRHTEFSDVRTISLMRRLESHGSRPPTSSHSH